MGMIIEKMQEFWDSLDTETVVNKKVLFLELLVCVFAGVLAGIIISPKKRVMIGCCNGDCIIEEAEIEKYEELKTLVEHLEIPVWFGALGASNPIPIQGTLPNDKKKVLSILDKIIESVSEDELRDYRKNLRHL